jgi:YgiT-type zinc finger domain-containing protein
MKCALCGYAETKPGHVTVPLQRGETTIILKNVPAEVCANCGEPYLSSAVTEEVLKKAEDAAKRGTELEILKYAA